MDLFDLDKAFSGPIPQFYERYLVPLIFAPYAADIARRAAARHPSRVLELGAGTGVVTRELARVLPRNVQIVATDLNRAMIEHAANIGTSRAVEWREADAMQMPFPDGTFDVIVCQFAFMFFPDKPRAFSEATRLLRPGGCLLFNVWDRLDENEFAQTATNALQDLFPRDPPRFLARVPHGYHEQSIIAKDLALGGFGRWSEFFTLSARSRAESARIPAAAYCTGTPLRNEIESRAPSRLAECTEAVTAAIAERFGSGAVDGKIQAHVVAVERPGSRQAADR